MPETNYIDIIKKAWAITWKNRFLWWFGAILALGSGIGMLDWPRFESDIVPEHQKQAFFLFFEKHFGWMIMGFLLAAAIILAIIIFSIIARAGLIRSIEKIIEKKSANFTCGMNEGKMFFWRILGLEIVIAASLMITILILSSPIVLLFANKDYRGGIILAVFAVIIFVLFLILWMFIRIFSHLYIVLGNLGVFSSIGNSYTLFKNNLARSLVMMILFIPISFAASFLFIALLGIIIIIFVALGFLLEFLFGGKGAVISIAGALIVLVPSMIFIRAIYEALSQSIWVVFFHEIASPKEKDELPEKQPEEEIPPIPDAIAKNC